jgi:hypothetical protein
LQAIPLSLYVHRLPSIPFVLIQISNTEAQGGVMRLIVGGGRAAETSESKGAVVVGVRTLSEGGRVGNFSREQVLKFIPSFVQSNENNR